jgi:hypothetical protein
VLHDGAEDCRLQVLPLGIVLADGDEVVTEINTRNAADFEQSAGQRRSFGFRRIAEVGSALLHHHLARQELQSRRIWRGFRLNEHHISPAAKADNLELFKRR